MFLACLLKRSCDRLSAKTGAFIFAPYHGTGLREIAIRKNYIKDPNRICDIRYPESSMLDQPQLRKKEVIGLARCFGLYQTLPKSKWKWIEKAEQDNKEGAKLRKDLVQDYHDITMKIHNKVRKNSANSIQYTSDLIFKEL